MSAQLIKDHLMSNRDYYRDLYDTFELSVRKTLKSQNNSIFHDDIDKQRDENFKRIIIDNTTSFLACDSESVIILLEDLNLKEYLNL